MDALVETWSGLGYQGEEAQVGRLAATRLPDLGIAAAVGGTGKAQFAVQTGHLLDASPECTLVICAGAAGALADVLSVGDVAIATSTVEHDYGNRFNNRPLPRFDGAGGVVETFRGLKRQDGSFEVHFGVVASGDEDIVDVGRRGELRRQLEAIAVAWEGAGGARACAFSGVPFVEIRGITDLADEGAPSDFHANLNIAMANLASLISSWAVGQR
jgi:adenosylhomocysteine nucleosidase